MTDFRKSGDRTKLNMEPAHSLDLEALCKSIGSDHVDVIDPVADHDVYVN